MFVENFGMKSWSFQHQSKKIESFAAFPSLCYIPCLGKNSSWYSACQLSQHTRPPEIRSITHTRNNVSKRILDNVSRTHHVTFRQITMESLHYGGNTQNVFLLNYDRHHCLLINVILQQAAWQKCVAIVGRAKQALDLQRNTVMTQKEDTAKEQ